MPSLFKQKRRYYLQFTNADRTPRCKKVSLGTTRKTEAQELKRRLVHLWQKGEYDPWIHDPKTLQPLDQRSLSLAETHKRHLEDLQRRSSTRSTLRTYRNVVGRFIRMVGPESKIDYLKPDDVTSFIHADGIRAGTKKKRYTLLRAWLNFCVDKEFMRASPLDQVPKPRPPQSHPKPISRDDLEALCQAIEADYQEKLKSGQCVEGEVIWAKYVILWGCYTGMRMSEIGRLRWQDVDLERGVIHIRQTKSRAEQTIPLSSRAREIVDQVGPGRPSEYVFHASTGKAQKRSVECWRRNFAAIFRKYRRRVGLPEYHTPHSTRHTFCSRLAEAGKSAATIRSLARHQSIRTSLRYIRMSGHHLRSELEDVF
jgi:integrase